MPTLVRIPRIAVMLVVAGGVIWLAAGVLYGVQVATCFSCGSVVVAPGVDTSSYSLSAIHTMAWDVLYANLYVATIGLLAIAIGLTAFRRGEKWAWLAMAIFAASGLFTAVLDEMAWGGWFTFLFLGLLPTLGVLLSTPAFFTGHGVSTQPPA
ncbi:MAG: hypothetical protein ACHQ01_10160 [Candidatus Limnocylindrales bacterium]